jgi:hypothetical protein
MSIKMPLGSSSLGLRLGLRLAFLCLALSGAVYYFFWPYFGVSDYPEAWSAPRLMVGDKGGCPDLTGAFDAKDADVWGIFTGYSSGRELAHLAQIAQSADGNELRITLSPNADTLAQLRRGEGAWPREVNELVFKRGQHYYCNDKRWLRLKAGEGAAVSRNRAGNLIISADRFSTSTLKVGVIESGPFTVQSTRWRQLHLRNANDTAALERAQGLEIRQIAQTEDGIVQAQIANFSGDDLCLRTWDSASAEPNERHANAPMIGGLSADETNCPAPWQRLRYPGMLYFNLQIDRPYRIAWRAVNADTREANAVDVVRALDLPTGATPLQDLPAAQAIP